MEKLRFTAVQKTAEAISACFIIALWVYIAAVWPEIPSKLPAHFNGSGMIDSWGGKGTLIAIAAVCTFLYAILTLISFFPKLWNIPVKVTEANFRAVYQSARNLLCFVKVFLTAMFFYMGVCIASASPLGPWLMPAALTAIFGTIVYSIVSMIIGSKTKA